MTNKKPITKQERWHARNPWARFLVWARHRCNNPRAGAYPKYGAVGISCTLKMEDVRAAWERDGAARMKKPSLDRVNPADDYAPWNIRFLEFTENSSRAWATGRG